MTRELLENGTFPENSFSERQTSLKTPSHRKHQFSEKTLISENRDF